VGDTAEDKHINELLWPSEKQDGAERLHRPKLFPDAGRSFGGLNTGQRKNGGLGITDPHGSMSQSGEDVQSLKVLEWFSLPFVGEIKMYILSVSLAHWDVVFCQVTSWAFKKINSLHRCKKRC